jgi:hypothetical protein
MFDELLRQPSIQRDKGLGALDKLKRIEDILKSVILFILSIFSRRCDSTKGPFFNDLPITIYASSSFSLICGVP